MTVEQLADHRPHIALYADDGAEVIPLALVEDWIAGKGKPEPHVMRVIIREWLSTITTGNEKE